MQRYRLARERAGLTLGQAAKLLGWNTVNLSTIELSLFRSTVETETKLADLYHVRFEWLIGVAELHDYASVDKIDGADKLSFHDRDIIAEFAASMPRRTK